jgi:hypothetical protein
LSITVNGLSEMLPDDPRVSLLDFLRECLRLHGTKKGCDQGAAAPVRYWPTGYGSCRAPGQICSAVALAAEAERGVPS